MAGTRVDGRLLRGEHTRRQILERAVAIASVEGLEGLSIGRLASELGASKSGVFAHFGSKEELQAAAVEAAVEVFVERVVRPGMQVPRGMRRLWALCDLWLDYARGTFPGGCFFVATAAEFDARPGRIRDLIARSRRDWLNLQEQTIDQARELGEIPPDTDPRQLAFELDAFVCAGNAAAQLHDDAEAYDRARRAVLARLRALATDAEVLPARP